jgi:hypothetical protein
MSHWSILLNSFALILRKMRSTQELKKKKMKSFLLEKSLAHEND